MGWPSLGRSLFLLFPFFCSKDFRALHLARGIAQRPKKGMRWPLKFNGKYHVIPVHCVAHCLQLLWQEADRKCRSLGEALDFEKKIVKLVKSSPKRCTLFAQNLENYEGGVTLKPLCPTRWTVRTAAFSAVLEDYVVLPQTMEDLSDPTHDEYGLRANGVLSSLDKLDSVFGLKLGYLLFGAAEQLSSANYSEVNSKGNREFEWPISTRVQRYRLF